MFKLFKSNYKTKKGFLVFKDKYELMIQGTLIVYNNGVCIVKDNRFNNDHYMIDKVLWEKNGVPTTYSIISTVFDKFIVTE